MAKGSLLGDRPGGRSWESTRRSPSVEIVQRFSSEVRLACRARAVSRPPSGPRRLSSRRGDRPVAPRYTVDVDRFRVSSMLRREMSTHRRAHGRRADAGAARGSDRAVAREVETPVAVIDLERLEANLQRLQSYADTHAIELWPHTKTHKSPEIGLASSRSVPGGLTVAKTGEAQVFQEAGARRDPRSLPDVSGPTSGSASRRRRGGSRADRRGGQLAPAEGLARVLDRRGLHAQLLVELDVGLHRTGQATSAGALGLAQELSRLRAVEVTGVSCYPGHLRPEDPTRSPGASKAVDELLRETRDAFSAAGLRCDRISGGSTPTRYSSARDSSTSSAPAPTPCSTASTLRGARARP